MNPKDAEEVQRLDTYLWLATPFCIVVLKCEDFLSKKIEVFGENLSNGNLSSRIWNKSCVIPYAVRKKRLINGLTYNSEIIHKKKKKVFDKYKLFLHFYESMKRWRDFIFF